MYFSTVSIKGLKQWQYVYELNGLLIILFGSSQNIFTYNIYDHIDNLLSFLKTYYHVTN